VAVDDKLRTTADGVYAAGDVCGGLPYAHVGHAQGSLAVENGLGRIPRAFDDRVLPRATFTDPEIGRVGLTEAEAHAAYGDAARVAYLPIAETVRAKTSGDVAGFVKLVAGPHPLVRGLAGGQLLGGTVVCPTAGDVVGELALAMRTHTVVGRLAQTIHAYPSWSLAVRECAVQFFTEYKGRSARVARPAEG
jgi:pyruvate/2-oxoglutarate dehydrogenase complex dihydrolipoamide dehydrogenase (E3) component